MLVLNVTCPLVPEEIRDFCLGKRAVLVVEEGQPEFIEQEILAILRRLDVNTPVHGKDLLPMAGEYTVEVIARGLAGVRRRSMRPTCRSAAGQAWLAAIAARRDAVTAQLAQPLPARPPSFCVGCPERPVFAALKLLQQDIGRVHIAADIGCHSFASFEPFSSGHTILGYGMSLASRAGVSPMMSRRTLAIMGDGGFWHNGLLSGVQSALFNGDDAVLVILKNGYTSATGTQEIISTPDHEHKAHAQDKHESLVHTNRRDRADAEGHRRAVAAHRRQLSRRRDATRRCDEAFTTGLRRAQGHHRRGRMPARAPAARQAVDRAAAARRASARSRVKYGVDEDTCSGDHSCIRLSGCPTLSLKASPDPLQVDPVATVLDGCVGCGLCGENAHAATLCPSFYRGEVIRNPNWRGPHLRRAAARRSDHAVPAGVTGTGCNAMTMQRPLTILIAALGGEGGGVLAEWLVTVAAEAGYPAQSTSIPGVAQRTGATTYYVEVWPEPIAALAGACPS